MKQCLRVKACQIIKGTFVYGEKPIMQEDGKIDYGCIPQSPACTALFSAP